MPIYRYRIKTLANGKRVKETISPSGRIVSVSPLTNKSNRTRTKKRLEKRKRRIYR